MRSTLLALGLLALPALLTLGGSGPAARAQSVQSALPAQPAQPAQSPHPATTPQPTPPAQPGGPGDHGQPARHPNLLILAIDTLRADHLGCYGYERPVSPSIDRLARAGLRFERALSNSPWTTPSFATMFTGRYPTRHGAGLQGPLRNLAVGAEGVPRTIAPGIPTLAEVLAKAGYRTCGIASNPYLLFGTQRGFAEFSCKFLRADRIGTLARMWIAQQDRDRPFYLFVHFNDPHEPTDPPSAFVKAIGEADALRDPNRKALTRWGGEPDDPTYLGRKLSAEAAAPLLRTKRALYDASVLRVDVEIGQIVAQLQHEGLLENTLVVVVSDHGEEFLDHAELERARGFDPRGIWGIGHGHSLFDELVHVPLIFFGAGLEQVTTAGRVIPQQFPLTELMPTLLGMLEVPAPDGMDGLDRREWLADPHRAPIPGAVEGIAYGPDLIGWCDGQHKLIAERIGRSLWGFDVAADPRERRDLLTAAPADSLSPLRAALSSWNDRVLLDAPPVAAAGEITPEMEQALKALGYAQ